MWHLLGESPYYPITLFLCLLLSSERLKDFIVMSLGILILEATVDITWLGYNPDYFFLIKAVFDVVWCVVVYLCVYNKSMRIKLWAVCVLGFIINIYVCLNTSYNIIYEYWNQINFLLFEVIIFILLSESPYVQNINTWLLNKAVYKKN